MRGRKAHDYRFAGGAAPIERIDVGLPLDEKLADVEAAARRRQVQARPRVVVDGVHRAAAVQQHLEEVEAAALGQLAQLGRGRHLIVPQLASPVAQQLGHLGPALAHRL